MWVCVLFKIITYFEKKMSGLKSYRGISRVLLYRNIFNSASHTTKNKVGCLSIQLVNKGEWCLLIRTPNKDCLLIRDRKIRFGGFERSLYTAPHASGKF